MTFPVLYRKDIKDKDIDKLQAFYRKNKQVLDPNNLVGSNDKSKNRINDFQTSRINIYIQSRTEKGKIEVLWIENVQYNEINDLISQFYINVNGLNPSIKSKKILIV